MKILVTGGAGFIASHVSDRLLSLGQRVTIVDNLSTGKRENLPEAASFYEIDIRDRSLEKVFEAEQPQVVIHHAAHANVAESVRRPGYNASVNIGGSINVFECCVRYGVERVVYASTGGALYGEACYIPADEVHPIDPVSPYGVSKHAVEEYLYAYGQTHGLEYVILRYPNVYGPRQDPHGEAGVVAIFSLQLLTRQRPTIFGDGGKTRDYCHVSDIVDANILSLSSPSGGIYNLGRGIEVSDLEVFENVQEAVGSDVRPIYAEVRPGEVEHMALNATKAEEELGWRWKVDMIGGVATTVESYRQQIERKPE
ncbi:MAG: NAD-dependent epimerase/dehydratase family protein [Actinobacteria bacterium]|jgi:UDP-glucose 4-epimerase|nr:NAD-dependent epimerase/dehydratase family protein [Actinomycetota bacterium]